MTKKQQLHTRAIEDLSLLIRLLAAQTDISSTAYDLIEQEIKRIKDNTPILYDLLQEVLEKGTKMHIMDGTSVRTKEVVQYTYAGYTIQISKDDLQGIHREFK